MSEQSAKETGRLKTILTVLAALAVIAAAVRVLVWGGSAVWDSPIGKIELRSNAENQASQFAGDVGVPRPGSNNQVWQSQCRDDTKPVSGTCIIEEGSAVFPLQNIGPNLDANRWECAWMGPVTRANVRAVCVVTKK
jgi:hypothetical protein